MIEPRFEYELREGQEIVPQAGAIDQNFVRYWLDLANNPAATHLQRVAAVILLFQQGVTLRIEVVENG